MKLITYQEFCKMPAGTIFAPYQPCVLDDRLSIKVDGGDEKGWFNGVMPLEPWNVEEIWEKGECPVSFETYDGANADYLDNDLFLVFDNADINRMIAVLEWAKRGCPDEGYEMVSEEVSEDCTDVLFYDEDDAAEFINAETGIDMSVIEQVINAEMKYMESIGIAYKEGE